MPVVATWFFGPGGAATEPVVVSRRPRVVYVPRFLAAADRAYLIARARPGLERGTVYDATYESRETANRTGLVAGLPGSSRRVRGLLERIAALGGLPVEHAENPQVLHYRKGQRFAPHLDAARFLGADGRRRLLDREITVLVALSGPWQGGATRFPRIGLEILPRPGDAFLFHNLDGRRRIDPLALHESLPVASGAKWLLAVFLREAAQRRPATS